MIARLVAVVALATAGVVSPVFADECLRDAYGNV